MNGLKIIVHARLKKIFPPSSGLQCHLSTAKVDYIYIYSRLYSWVSYISYNKQLLLTCTTLTECSWEWWRCVCLLCGRNWTSIHNLDGWRVFWPSVSCKALWMWAQLPALSSKCWHVSTLWLNAYRPSNSPQFNLFETNPRFMKTNYLLKSCSSPLYRVIRNDCWGFNNLSCTMHFR